MTVNVARVRLFVEALRSGKFRRIGGVLAFYDSQIKKYKYCCLGVACEVALANGLDIPRTRTSSGNRAYDEASVLLPLAVTQWFGFDDTDPMIDLIPEDYTRSGDPNVRRNAKYQLQQFAWHASNANDNLQLPFSVIANAFERTYLHANADTNATTNTEPPQDS